MSRLDIRKRRLRPTVAIGWQQVPRKQIIRQHTGEVGNATAAGNATGPDLETEFSRATDQENNEATSRPLPVATALFRLHNVLVVGGTRLFLMLRSRSDE